MTTADDNDKNTVVAATLSRDSAAEGCMKASGAVPKVAPLGPVTYHRSAQLHGMLGLVPFAVLRIGLHGRIVQANPAAEGLFGYRRNALAGVAIAELIPGLGPNWGRHPSILPAPAAAKDSPAAANAPPPTLARHANGSEIPVTVVTAPISPATHADVLMTIIDQSELCELERNRKALAHMTRVSTLGQLAGSLAHELNQPLTAILSNAQTAQRIMAAPAWDPSEIREILNDLVKDNRRASDVLRKVRLLVKQGTPECAPMNLAAVIEDVALLVHSDAIVRGIRLSMDIGVDLPSVWGDKVQLQQVVLNLVLNAFEALSAREPADRVVNIAISVEAPDMILVSVRDRGCGFAGDVINSIFTPYFTSKREGLGLGLWISRSIIERHGGRIWAEHNHEQGAAILFTVPRMQSTCRPAMTQA